MTAEPGRQAEAAREAPGRSAAPREADLGAAAVVEPFAAAAQVAEAAAVAAAEAAREEEPAHHPLGHGGQPAQARGRRRRRTLQLPGKSFVKKSNSVLTIADK